MARRLVQLVAQLIALRKIQQPLVAPSENKNVFLFIRDNRSKLCFSLSCYQEGVSGV